jgi:hypothetical protein
MLLGILLVGVALDVRHWLARWPEDIRNGLSAPPLR